MKKDLPFGHGWLVVQAAAVLLTQWVGLRCRLTVIIHGVVERHLTVPVSSLSGGLLLAALEDEDADDDNDGRGDDDEVEQGNACDGGGGGCGGSMCKFVYQCDRR